MATWNLRHGRGDLGAVAARIAALGGDVVAVQEVDRGLARSGYVDQVAEIARRLGWHGLFVPAIVGRARTTRATIAEGGCQGRPAYGVGLLSRAPLGAATRVVLPSGSRPVIDSEPRVVLRSTVPTPLGDVQIYVTHLSWVPWRAWDQLRSVLDLAGERPGPAVVAGDLNVPARWLAAAVAGTGWRTARATPTFPARRPYVQLDHILVRDAQLGDACVAPAGPSDHRLLSASVGLAVDGGYLSVAREELKGAAIDGGLVA